MNNNVRAPFSCGERLASSMNFFSKASTNLALGLFLGAPFHFLGIKKGPVGPQYLNQLCCFCRIELNDRLMCYNVCNIGGRSMNACSKRNTCLFFNYGVSGMPHTARYIKDNYCQGDPTACPWYVNCQGLWDKLMDDI